jgi:hypothetical protein
MTSTVSESDLDASTELPHAMVNHFSIAHFFIRPLPGKDFRVLDPVNDRSPSRYHLEAPHFNFLWLIRELLKTPCKTILGKTYISTDQLRRAFFWYMSVEEHQKDKAYINYQQHKLDDCIKKLKETKLIEVKAGGYYCLTRKGIAELATLFKKRSDLLLRLVGDGKITILDFNAFLERLEQISPQLWQQVLDSTSHDGSGT